MSLQMPSMFRNHLLQRMHPDDSARLRDIMEHVSMPHKQVLHKQNAPVDHVYFIEDGMVSVIAVMADGAQVEVGVAGCEGLIGLSAIHGNSHSVLENTVQIPGSACRVPAQRLRREMDGSDRLRGVLLRYADSFLTMVSRGVACNARHNLEQRLARWLLTAHDRAPNDQLPLTHEFMAIMLGVRRPGISVAAAALQRAGLIRYSYGRVTVLNRKGLERLACECYGAVASEFAEMEHARVKQA